MHILHWNTSVFGHTLQRFALRKGTRAGVMKHRAALTQAESQQRHCSLTCAEVCEVLQQFFQESHAQHLKLYWVVQVLQPLAAVLVVGGTDRW